MDKEMLKALRAVEKAWRQVVEDYRLDVDPQPVTKKMNAALERAIDLAKGAA